MKITIQSESSYYEATIKQNYSAPAQTEMEASDDFASVLAGQMNDLSAAGATSGSASVDAMNRMETAVTQAAAAVSSGDAEAAVNAAADLMETFSQVTSIPSVVTNQVPASILGGVNPTAYAAGTILNVARDGYGYVSSPAESAGQGASSQNGNTASSTAAQAAGTISSSAAGAVKAGNASSAGASAAAASSANLDDIFTEAAEKYGVDKRLLLAVAKTESNFHTDATSSAGAMGVMQLMPQTAAGIGVTNAYDPYQNIMGGARLLSDHLSQYDGNLDLALAAYNAGAGTVKKYGGVPPFTEKYIAKVKEYMADPTLAAPGV